ncbi:MAG: hypothetical protein INR65_06270 [Gluconacetobacter diazotrophicus]|nr:hypothetical protein [Gluconacetobacter diazotrophicus]
MKTPSELEYRTLRFLEAGAADPAPLNTAGGPTACFATWPGPPLAAARRLAAHANAARGQSLLWLVGVRHGKPTGADASGLDAWLAGVTRHFDGLAPRVRAYNVPAGRGHRGRPLQVVALAIETERAPFVIRLSGGQPSFDVPWFDTSDGAIRSAGRLELVKLLAPLNDLPRFEVLEAELTFYHNPHAGSGSKALYRWTLDGSLYVMPAGDARVVVPLHRCHGGVASPDGSFTSQGTDFSLTADKGSSGVRVTESAALIEGLGRMFIYACGATAHREVAWQEKMSVRLDLAPAGADRAAVAVAELRPEPTRESNQAGRWKL